MLRALKRRLIFFSGDIRREHCPGGFAWGKYEHLIDYDEAEAAMINHTNEDGYIGLHRNRGDLSNIAIPGFMKHAWLHTRGWKIIEAVSEGVLHRHALHALMSDYVIVVKPLLPWPVLKEAVQRGLSMVGCPYDYTFTFDLEIEAEMFADKQTALANMRKFGLGVSCSEMVALTYVGHRRELGLYRTKMGSKQVIKPDAFLSTHFEIVWASKHVTADNAFKLGLHEEGIEMIKAYRKDHEYE